MRLKRLWFVATLLAAASATHAQPQEVRLARFFGSCEARFGNVTDPQLASSECGIITALANRFNARHGEQVRWRTQVVEHASYYNQLGARIVGRDVPTLAILHASELNDFVKRGLVMPLDPAFAQVGIDPADFTPQTRRGVTIDGRVWALPHDTHSWLWHVNLHLMKQAGLVDAQGQALIPRSPEQLIDHARRFKAATGKPYLVWSSISDPMSMSRTVLSLVHQQGGSLFPHDGLNLALRTPEAERAIALLRTLWDEGLATRDMDYSASLQGFLGGAGGVLLGGTWVLGDLATRSQREGSAISGGYAALPFPTLFGTPSVWADSHVWVMLKGGARSEAEQRAAWQVLKFLYDEAGAWARTGQLPPRQSVVDGPAYRALPMRPQIAEIASSGRMLPAGVARQRRVMGLVGEAVAAVVVSGKPQEETLREAEVDIGRMLRRESRFWDAPPR
jgi:multiple sugar transport system substrate-binding protein